jgi:hypothetical protein
VPKPWRYGCLQACAYGLRPLRILDRGAGSLGGHLLAQGLDDSRMPELLDQLGVCRLVDQPSYWRGQG